MEYRKRQSLTVRMTQELAAKLDAEATTRGVSRSMVVRERLEGPAVEIAPSGFAAIADLVGSVDALPADLSTRRKDYLKRTGYGRKRSR